MPLMMVTVRELRYGGKPHAKGDTFEASEKDAKLLRVLKRAVDAASTVETPLAATSVTAPLFAVTRAIEADDDPVAPEPTPLTEGADEPETTSEPPPAGPKPTGRGRKYNTRRLTARD